MSNETILDTYYSRNKKANFLDFWYLDFWTTKLTLFGVSWIYFHNTLHVTNNIQTVSSIMQIRASAEKFQTYILITF